PTAEQWDAIAEVLAERGALPLVDFAYQGFATGIDEDAGGIRTLAARLPELVVVSSYSKNFGLYQDRTGAAMFITETADHAAALAHVVVNAERLEGRRCRRSELDPACIRQRPSQRGIPRHQPRAGGIDAHVVHRSRRTRPKGAGHQADVGHRLRRGDR
ncbi:aminotransferase class I/II-fold pyridoxal phosphate-dependent enzyme, partial [Planococcus sp. SIMBA_160]